MTKILAESLYEFRKENVTEDINEAIQPGKTFRQNFLKAGHALVAAGRKDNVKVLLAWAKKLKSLGWPKESVLKQELGDKKFKSFLAALNLVNKQLPSFAAKPGGSAQRTSGGNIGESTEERLEVIANATGITVEELKGILTK